ncbi:MAG: YjbE family putative metal transport protein, partial [Actinobacteria bacterium]|nr:YjbE family putative metal transport protein [Actinomycetota bacterium]
MNFDWSLLVNPSWIWSTLGAVFAIIVIDLALSGDNAAVIGLAIKDLPGEQRRTAAILGAGGAIVLRVIFTALATLLMNVKFINAIGGALLFWITWKLVMHKGGEEHVKSGSRFWGAIWAIIVADLSMAFDNVMGVAGAAHGSVALVIFGLLLSVPILVWGSSWLAAWMNKQ